MPIAHNYKSYIYDFVHREKGPPPCHTVGGGILAPDARH